MRWYQERQALKQMQITRTSSSAKAVFTLQLSSSRLADSSAPGTPETNAEAELADFDQKIYAAQKMMDVAMSAELKSLGVPFFGTEESLVVPDEYDEPKEQPPERYAKFSRLVTESELLGLKRKMIGHLEDLYR